MHKILMADGTFRQSKSLRSLRTIAYALIGAAGSMLIISDFFVPAFGPSALVMAWFLVVGGFASALGAGFQRWMGEYIGLPLLCTSFIVFGILTVIESFEAMPWISGANMAVLTGVSLLMAGRWRVVHAVYRLAVRFPRADK